jgi:hypothetical protein
LLVSIKDALTCREGKTAFERIKKDVFNSSCLPLLQKGTYSESFWKDVNGHDICSILECLLKAINPQMNKTIEDVLFTQDNCCNLRNTKWFASAREKLVLLLS